MKKETMNERKYPSRRRELIKFLQDSNGNLGEGLERESLCNCVLMIVDYFNYKFPNFKIPAKAIPDIEDFKEKNLTEEYTIEQFIYNRLYSNLKGYVIADRPPEGKNPEALGGYNSRTKLLTIYKENFYNRISKSCAIVGEQYRESLMQEVVVHELIHAISKTKGLGSGLIEFDEQNKKQYVSLNEGITERLAMDICELPDVFLTVKKDDFQVSANTISSYKLETGIANLLSIVEGEKFYLKYLVDAKRISINRGGENLMGVLREVTNKHKPTLDSDIEREKVSDYQKLQDLLISDIFDNKLQKELLDPVRAGERIDEKQFKRLRKEMYEIGKCLIPTIKDANEDEELDFTSTVEYIRGLVKEGKIERTPNIDKFVGLIGAMKEVERDLGISKGVNERVKYNR